MNTPADNFIMELMMKTEETPLAEGQLEIYDAKSDIPVRQIKFSKAYITEFRETFNLLDDDRMTTYVKISPTEMTINKRIKIERRLFWLWSKALQEPMKMAEVIADTDVHLNDAYWIKTDGGNAGSFLLGKL